MTEIVVKVGSVTNAHRAKRVLEKNGYRCRVQRSHKITKGEGCGYSVVTNCDESTLRELLANAVVRIISVST